ncbi:MAG: aminodeoxychorismate/anthranilate synthase component II [Planctomycetota bacterium]
MLLLIDNYDSFTYNLVQAFGQILQEMKDERRKMKGGGIRVFRNDKITLAKAKGLKPTHLVISPGPKRPEDAGVSNQLIKYFAGRIPTLGVCLGHQCLSYIFGGRVIRAKTPVHGKTSLVYHDNKTIFRGLSNPFTAMRYHSLIVDAKTLPECFEVSARTKDGEIMGIRRKDALVEGVQFHPESYLTPEGKRLLENFLSL